MDAVRFGKALGIGARSTGKALVQAAQAAAATPREAAKRNSPPTNPVHTATRARGAATQVVRTAEGVVRGGQRFSESAWRPFIRLSGVLWLEFTGVFFGIFLLFAVTNAWRLRSTVARRAADPAGFHHLLWSLGMAGVFGYFAISSFVRARRRERSPG